MATKVEDVLQVNLVLVGLNLLNTQQETAAFRQAAGTEVLSTETGVANEVISRTHTLNRDRITIARTPDRSSVVREFPREEDLARLAQVAVMAISNTDLTEQALRAFGYNIDLIYEADPPEDAIGYLGERLFRADLFQGEQRNLRGGSGKIYFEKDGRYWQAALEPRLNDENTTRIFASVNLHRPQADLSQLTEYEIRNSLELLWAEAHNLVNEIDGETKK